MGEAVRVEISKGGEFDASSLLRGLQCEAFRLGLQSLVEERFLSLDPFRLLELRAQLPRRFHPIDAPRLLGFFLLLGVGVLGGEVPEDACAQRMAPSDIQQYVALAE